MTANDIARELVWKNKASIHRQRLQFARRMALGLIAIAALGLYGASVWLLMKLAGWVR